MKWGTVILDVFGMFVLFGTILTGITSGIDLLGVLVMLAIFGRMMYLQYMATREMLFKIFLDTKEAPQ